MAAEGMDYPLHLGVTEAGDGEDGRIKSAVGIGTLLDEGIGDTVRVSLTEDPVREIPVARALVENYNRAPAAASTAVPVVAEARDPFSFARRRSHAVTVGPHTVGHGETVLVEVPLRGALSDEPALRAELDAQAGVRVPQETRAEVVGVEVRDPRELDALERLRQAVELVAPKVALSARVRPGWILGLEDDEMQRWVSAAHRLHVPLAAPMEVEVRADLGRLIRLATRASRSVLLETAAESGPHEMEDAVEFATHAASLESPAGPRAVMLALAPSPGFSPLHGVRLLAARLAAAGHDTPLVLLDDPLRRGTDELLAPSAALGGLLCDGIGDAVHLAGVAAGDSRRLAFGILQAARVRTTKTEFISCPSCGRTLFDLEETTARIKARTSHLKGVKIAVMGCVVNGPGEMADADFGYVGWGENKIALFVGREMVARDIPTAEADERLVELIKQHGRWVEPGVLTG
jgi:(E)-4-hydroxy-3-methylbut-2-enyl-diphosphate synthase